MAARHFEPPPEWRVTHDGWGRIIVVDERGVPLFRDRDPVIALEQAFLAAAAPQLRHVIAPLVRRLERIEVDHGIPIMGRDDQRIGLAWHALLAASPGSEQYLRAITERAQVEIAFEDVA